LFLNLCQLNSISVLERELDEVNQCCIK
jgi:hypothetical protein